MRKLTPPFDNNSHSPTVMITAMCTVWDELLKQNANPNTSEHQRFIGALPPALAWVRGFESTQTENSLTEQQIDVLDTLDYIYLRYSETSYYEAIARLTEVYVRAKIAGNDAKIRVLLTRIKKIAAQKPAFTNMRWLVASHPLLKFICDSIRAGRVSIPAILIRRKPTLQNSDIDALYPSFAAEQRRSYSEGKIGRLACAANALTYSDDIVHDSNKLLRMYGSTYCDMFSRKVTYINRGDSRQSAPNFFKKLRNTDGWKTHKFFAVHIRILLEVLYNLEQGRTFLEYTGGAAAQKKLVALVKSEILLSGNVFENIMIATCIAQQYRDGDLQKALINALAENIYISASKLQPGEEALVHVGWVGHCVYLVFSATRDHLYFRLDNTGSRVPDRLQMANDCVKPYVFEPMTRARFIEKEGDITRYIRDLLQCKFNCKSDAEVAAVIDSKIYIGRQFFERKNEFQLADVADIPSHPMQKTGNCPVEAYKMGLRNRCVVSQFEQSKRQGVRPSQQTFYHWLVSELKATSYIIRLRLHSGSHDYEPSEISESGVHATTTTTTSTAVVLPGVDSASESDRESEDECYVFSGDASGEASGELPEMAPSVQHF